jgi:hypothetical protein
MSEHRSATHVPRLRAGLRVSPRMSLRDALPG